MTCHNIASKTEHYDIVYMTKDVSMDMASYGQWNTSTKPLVQSSALNLSF